MSARKPRRINRRAPPRYATVVLIRARLASKLKEFARMEGKSISKLINDWLSDAIGIDERDR